MNKTLLFSIEELNLKTLLEVKYAKSYEEFRPILQGVCFNSKNGQIEVCALDGYRLSVRKLESNINNNFNFVIDHESILNLSKVPKKNDNIVNVYSVNDTIEFEFTSQDNKIIKCSLLQGDFVKYNNLIPDEYELEIKVDAKKVLEAVKTIKKTNSGRINERSRIIKLIVQDYNLIIEGKRIEEEYSEEESLRYQQGRQKDYDEEYKTKYERWIKKNKRFKEPVKKTSRFEKVYIITKEEDININIPCKINKNNLDNNFRIAFNIKYIDEAVKPYKNEITLKFNSNRSPAIITQDDKNLEMVLPIRLLND